MTVFDLSLISSEKYRRSTRPVRRLLAVSVVAFSALLTGIIAYNLARHTLPTNFVATYGAPYWGLAFGIGFCLWAQARLSAGAVRLKVDDQSLLFSWSSGRTDELCWTDPKFRLDLWDWTSNLALARFTNILHWARLPGRPTTSIPEPAFNAIIEGAQAHGLVVEVSSPSPGWYGPNRRLRLRAKPG